FRAAHTLEGRSATEGYEDLASLTHNLENMFEGIRNENNSVNADVVDILFEVVDALNEMLDDISNGGQGAKDITSTVESLDKMERKEELQSVSSEEIIKTGALQTNEKLDEFELSILNESIERGYFNYEITVILREDCVLKGARAFMVFDVLEK